jgi:hypothetical protein
MTAYAPVVTAMRHDLPQLLAAEGGTGPPEVYGANNGGDG